MSGCAFQSPSGCGRRPREEIRKPGAVPGTPEVFGSSHLEMEEPQEDTLNLEDCHGLEPWYKSNPGRPDARLAHPPMAVRFFRRCNQLNLGELP